MDSKRDSRRTFWNAWIPSIIIMRPSGKSSKASMGIAIKRVDNLIMTLNIQMQDFENEQELEFLITQEKERKDAEGSQEKMSFNLSVTIKDSSIKHTPINHRDEAQPFQEVSPYRFDDVDAGDFFENFDKYYKIEGLTPIKHTLPTPSPVKMQQKMIDTIKEGKQSEEKYISDLPHDNRGQKLREAMFHKKKHRTHVVERGDSRSRLKQILRQKPLKTIINCPNTQELIKINNISLLVLSNKSKVCERKNTPILNMGKKSKTISSGRRNKSVVIMKRVMNSPNPSIFCDKKKGSDIFKPTESWKGHSNINPCSKQFQIHKKSKMLKWRPSNHSWGQDICRISPKFVTIRI